MNKIVKAVASFMIVILIIALVYILISYYEKNEIINTNVSTLMIPSGEYMINEKHTGNESLIESIIKGSSGNSNNESSKDNNLYKSGDTLNEETPYTSGENMGNEQSYESNQTQHNSGDNIPNVIVEVTEPKDSSNQLVITSDSETSNQEKQQILTEIDEALKGLLEAVGKVETVDEERLNTTLDSEVDGR